MNAHIQHTKSSRNVIVEDMEQCEGSESETQNMGVRGGVR